MNGKTVTYCIACGVFFYVSLVPHTCRELSQRPAAKLNVNQPYIVIPNPSVCVAIDEKIDHSVENDFGGQGPSTTYTTVSGTASGASTSTTTTI